MPGKEENDKAGASCVIITNKSLPAAMLQEGPLDGNACEDARGGFHFGNPYLSSMCSHLESLVQF